MDQRPHRVKRRAAILAAAAAALQVTVIAPTASGAAPGEPLVGRPFAPVVEGVVRGDLLLAGNSNLLAAGGWRDGSDTAADVDGDATRICGSRRRVCADNSSSAEVDVPAGARIIAARLYVETSVGKTVGPLRVALDGPSDGFSYRRLPATSAPSSSPSKLYEAIGDGPGGAVLRQAVWDITAYVATDGAGTYTVADIVNERVGPWLPYASWAIVVAYELDPDWRPPKSTAPASPPGSSPGTTASSSSTAPRWTSRSPASTCARPRSARASTSSPAVGPGAATTCCSRAGPLGNNNTLDDAPPPPGVQLGTDPACNTVTDVQNDSICVLGSTVGHEVAGRRRLPVVRRRRNAVVRLGRRHGRDPHPGSLPPQRRRRGGRPTPGHGSRTPWPPG